MGESRTASQQRGFTCSITSSIKKLRFSTGPALHHVGGNPTAHVRTGGAVLFRGRGGGGGGPVKKGPGRGGGGKKGRERAGEQCRCRKDGNCHSGYPFDVACLPAIGPVWSLVLLL